MTVSSRRGVLALVMMMGLWSASASAQVFGTFAWQMQPYCNVVTLTITQFPGGYTVDGSDNQCGSATLAAATGQVHINPDGSVGVNFAIITTPTGKAVHVAALLSPATGSGTWTDSVGNSGTFALGANVVGLPARPLPTSGVAAATITATEIAAAAVGAAELAAGAVTGVAVADGSLAMVDIANGPRLNSASADVETQLTTTSVVFATVTLAVPGAGKVMANASGYFRFDDTSATTEYARCSVTTGSAVEFAALIIGSDFGSTAPTNYEAFGATRTFTVSAAGSFTVNLACNVFTGTLTKIGDPQLTALFVAQ